MGSLFRSEKMTLAQLFLQSEAAYSCVREIGELGRIQFRDLNPEVSAFQRKFTNEVRRCDEMERKLRFLNNELVKAGIDVQPSGNVEAPDPQDMIDLESKFEELEGEVKEIKANKETLKKNLLDLMELQHILVKTHIFFQEAEQYTLRGGANKPIPTIRRKVKKVEEGGLLDSGEDTSDLEMQKQKLQEAQTKFTFVTGVINRERMGTFERLLWRACRGNVFLKQTEITEPLEDPSTGKNEFKFVFIVFFQGDQLRTRVRKICEAFQATLYQCPETAIERSKMTKAVKQRITDLQSVLQTTEDHSNAQFHQIAKDIDTWQTKVIKMKAIYHTMNLFNLDVTQRCLIAECWCPVEDLEEIQRTLQKGTVRSGSTVPSILNRMKSDESPPTYNKVNKFTRGFQAIVDAYGIATYEEVNPTPYTIITFPFLFAVMFGDAGHGLIMAAFALSLIVFEKKLANNDVGGEMFRTMYDGRYIIFLMGAFSIYTGLIYNDIFAKSANFFGSSWEADYTESLLNISTNYIGDCCQGLYSRCVIMGAKDAELTTFPREAMKELQPYPFGFDPIWNIADNKLVYTNSYKMKLAVILGIIQMAFGVILSVFNHVHFKQFINVFVEFIPQMLFLMSIFGWLVFMIFYKWCYHYENPNTAPSLLITLINMFLEFGGSPSVNSTTSGGEEDNEYSVFGPTEEMANIQLYIQVFFVLTAVLCIPIMLCIKPFYLLVRSKQKGKEEEYHQVVSSYNVTIGSSTDDDEEQQIIHDDELGKKETDELDKKTKEALSAGEHQEEQFELSEAFVHQAIHTIEYCLGTISNTASYLRLWALSLAHAELSEVLWEMVLNMGIGMGVDMGPAVGIIAVFFLFAFWAVLTIGILLVMEGLSAFLHALRLHWVEFQNKFYDGNGYKFKPFSFEAILKGDDQDF